MGDRPGPAVVTGGETGPGKPAGLAPDLLQASPGKLERVRQGLVESHRCCLLDRQLYHLEHPDAEIEALDVEVAQRLLRCEPVVAALDTTP